MNFRVVFILFTCQSQHQFSLPAAALRHNSEAEGRFFQQLKIFRQDEDRLPPRSTRPGTGKAQKALRHGDQVSMKGRLYFLCLTQASDSPASNARAVTSFQ
jgi:hypothetical protein